MKKNEFLTQQCVNVFEILFERKIKNNLKSSWRKKESRYVRCPAGETHQAKLISVLVQIKSGKDPIRAGVLIRK